MPASDGAPSRKSRTSGTEKVMFSPPGPVHRVAQVDEPVAVAVGQRLEQHAADDAEDRRVGADAERQREDDDGGEAGAVSQRAQRVPEIGRDALEPGQSALVAHGFGRLREAAGREQRLRGAPRPGAMPRRMFSAVSISRCACISSRRSSSARVLAKTPAMRASAARMYLMVPPVAARGRRRSGRRSRAIRGFRARAASARRR